MSVRSAAASPRHLSSSDLPAASGRHLNPAVLLVTADDVLVHEVSRLAAAAGAALEVVPSPADAIRAWGSAAVVLVGPDLAGPLAGRHPHRREDLHLVVLGTAPETLLRQAVELGAATVLELPDRSAWLVEAMCDLDDRRRSGITVGVVGGSGGVGATVLAAALALTAASSSPVMLVDLDPLGPGVRRILGLDEPTGVTWADLADLEGRVGSRSLRDALPVKQGAAVLGWSDDLPAPPRPGLVRDVVAAARRGHDWVVLDLPRSLDDGLLGCCDHLLLVARSDLPSVASAGRVVQRLTAVPSATHLVVRRRRGSLAAQDVSRALSVPLLAELSHQRRIDEHLDLGLGPVHDRRGPIAKTAARVLDRMSAHA